MLVAQELADLKKNAEIASHGHKTEIENLKKANADATAASRQEINGLKQAAAADKRTIERLTNDLGTLQLSAKDDKATIARLQTASDADKATAGRLQDEVRALQAKYDSAKNDIARLQHELAQQPAPANPNDSRVRGTIEAALRQAECQTGPLTSTSCSHVRIRILMPARRPAKTQRALEYQFEQSQAEERRPDTGEPEVERRDHCAARARTAATDGAKGRTSFGLH